MDLGGSVPLPTTAPNSVASSDSLSRAHTKHIRFYFPDGSCQFVVEDTAYSIHRWWVARHSSGWPQVLRDANQGASPTVFENVTVPEMDALLSVIYPTDVRQRDLTSIEDWTSVLRLSTRWGFTSCRQLALDFLKSRVPALDKLVLAHELDIPDWLESAYIALCLKEELLTLAEGQRLPLADVFAIFAIREAIHKGQIPATIEIVSERVKAFIGEDKPTATTSATLPAVEPLDAVLLDAQDGSSSLKAFPTDNLPSPTPSPTFRTDNLPSPARSRTTQTESPPSPTRSQASSFRIEDPPSPTYSPIPQSRSSKSESTHQASDRPPTSSPPIEDTVDKIAAPSGSDTASALPAGDAHVTPTTRDPLPIEPPPLPEPKPSTILPPPRRAKTKTVLLDLYEGAYELAVDEIIPLSARIGQSAPTIAEWANTHVSRRGVGSLRSFVSALFSRAIRDITFDEAAISILIDLKRDIHPTSRDVRENKGRGTLRGAKLIDDLVQSISLNVVQTPSAQTAYNNTRSVIFRSSVTILPSAEYAIRRRNADIFVGKLLKNRLLEPHYICASFRETYLSPAVLRDRLVVLGPFLDRFGGEKNLDDLLTSHETRALALENKVDQGILQGVRNLRSQKWATPRPNSGAEVSTTSA